MGTPIGRNESTKYVPSNSARNYVFTQSGWTGDYITPTTYSAKRARGQAGTGYTGNPYYVDVPNTRSLSEFVSAGGIPTWARPAANAAYEDFREKATGSQSSLGAAFGEWSESLGMITNRARQLATSFNALRRRDFGAALRAWKSKPHRPGSRLANLADKASGLWLEYSFGWKPMMGDIFSAAEQMSEDLPSDHHQGDSGAGGTFNSAVNYLRYSDHRSIRHNTGAFVKLSNPNLYLAAQLGLVNPLSVAWELIPGSFVADWMFDVGGFLNSFSDFAGVEIINPWRSHVLNFQDTVRDVRGGNAAIVIGYGCERKTSLIQPLPNMEVQANLGASITRAANTVALGAQAIVAALR